MARIVARCSLCGGEGYQPPHGEPITIAHAPTCEEHPDNLLLCEGGCGMTAEACICPLDRWAPEPYRTFTDLLRETEADIWADPEAHGTTREAWAKVAQWPDPNEEK